MAGADLAVAFAGSAALAATMPLAAARAVPPPVRAALALAIAPCLATPVPTAAPLAAHLIVRMLAAAVFGVSCGLAASAIAGAVSSAGSLVDAAMAMPSIGVDVERGQSAGPFASLFALAFAVAMTQSGALTWLIAGYAATSAHLAALAPPNAAHLGSTVFAFAFACALPALAAHALAAVVTGAVARTAARINGILLAPALSSCCVLVVMAAGSFAVWRALAHMAQVVAHAANAL